MKKTCSKCGCQVYDPFGGLIKMHDEEKCCGIVRAGFAITEPILDIADSITAYTEIGITEKDIDDINKRCCEFSIKEDEANRRKRELNFQLLDIPCCGTCDHRKTYEDGESYCSYIDKEEFFVAPVFMLNICDAYE